MVASAGFDALLREIVDVNLVAGQRRNLRDAAAHLAGADNTDLLDHEPCHHRPTPWYCGMSSTRCSVLQ